jgi:hypothetical protein
MSEWVGGVCAATHASLLRGVGESLSPRLRAGNTTQQTEGLRLRLGVLPQAVQ